MTDENLRRSIRAIGILQYFISILLFLSGIMLCVLLFFDPELRAGSARGFVSGIFVIGLSVFYFVLARKLRELKSWARTATMVISCIGLLGVPIGTIINAAFLYVLIEGKHLFHKGVEKANLPPIVPIDR